MGQKVLVVGVGMTPFSQPGTGGDYKVMAAQAAKRALKDAGVDYRLVEQAYVGSAYGSSACGQAALYNVGLSGLPIFNVNNRCASGASALYLARQSVECGAADCVLALGFEQLDCGASEPEAAELEPLNRYRELCRQIQGLEPAVSITAQLFGGAARMHMIKYGTSRDIFARIAVKARRHAARNPQALLREEITLDQVLASPVVFEPLTQLQCCPPASGAAAALICSARFALRHGLDSRVSIAAQAMSTDRNSSFDECDMRKLVGYDLTREAARRVYEAAGIGPRELDVIELHDSFTSNELTSYEALGLAAEGEGERLVLAGDNTYGGGVVVNPSGGLLAQGHPPGASGLAQCAELVQQLRGQAGSRQVENARFGLQHNAGLGSACIVTLYQAA